MVSCVGSQSDDEVLAQQHMRAFVLVSLLLACKKISFAFSRGGGDRE